MYLDTDVFLAELKADDWLQSDVDLGAIDDPVTSVATCIEIQYVMEDEWDRERLTRLPDEMRTLGVRLVPLESAHLEAGGELQRSYAKLNFFDAIHLGTATVLDESIVSTDTLYPDISDVESIDPRDL